MDVQARENFRVNLLAAILHRGISQRELAKRAEAGYPQVNRILRGHSTPTLEAADRLADAVQVPLPTLLSAPKIFRREVVEKIPEKVS